MDSEFNLAFLKVKDILYDLAGQNDLLFLDLEYDEWNSMLKKRSKKIREIFNSYMDTIAFINRELDKDDPILYDIAYENIGKFKDEEIHDSGFTIPIMERLISYYEKEGNRHRLLFLYLNYGYECMEYYLRMGNFSYKEKVRNSFLKVLKLKDHYKELTKKEKARFFIAYYNLTGALPDVVKEYQKDIVYYYQDLLDFCFKDSIKIDIEENEDAIDEIYYVVEAFLYGFARYLDKNALYRDEYFYLVERTLNLFKDLDKDTLRIGHIILDYYYKKYDIDVLFLKLEEMNNEYLNMNLVFDGTEDSILEFCNWMDINSSLKEIIPYLNMDKKEKKAYVKMVTEPILKYISLMNYKDYTSYIDDISSDLFNSMLPYMDGIDEKLDLIQRLIIRRQPITYIHSLMVKRISEEITMKILKDKPSLLKPLEDVGIRGADILDYIGCAAMLHDLGKCLTVGVINCQGRRLTKDEFECIKLHPKRALVFLKDDSDFNPYIDIMIGHHKFYDGSGGYPIDFDNTKSKYRIAIDIISIADSIDAATDILGRNYTMGKDFNTLLMELKESMGKRYNPDIVSLILEDDELKDRLTYLVTEGREKVYFMAYKEIKES